MSKIFISYRRKSWGFTHRLAEELQNRLDADVFVDFSGIDDDEFERSILNNLRQSDVVLLIITEHTFADRIHRDDDWVRREVREALENNIPIVLVAVEGRYPPSGLPQDIQDVGRKQGIPFYPEYFIPAVEKLAEFVVKIGAAELRKSPSANPPQNTSSGDKTIGGRKTLNEALELLDDNDFEKAIFLLEQLKKQNFKSRAVKIDDILHDAREHLERAEYRRHAKEEYDDIVMQARRKFTRARAKTEWKNWCETYPDLIDELDTQDLRSQFASKPPPSTKPDIRAFLKSILPEPFDIIDIPAGKVTLLNDWDSDEKVYLKKDQPQTFDVPPFSIAKYPVTNAQFEQFMNESGYDNDKWWTDAGWKQRQKDGWAQPRYWNDDQWKGADYPVVGVSWYESLAFCHWLNAKIAEEGISDVKISLPTEQQWQRSAQGDDNRTYPWEGEWDCKRCNNSVDPCDSNGTTSVRQYEGKKKGDSPYGVVDMAGNVWEWCLIEYYSGNINVNGTDVRVLRGGSWNDSLTDNFRCLSRYWVLSSLQVRP